MRGIKFVRNRVSIMTAALEEFVMLVSEARMMLFWGVDFVLGEAEGEGVVGEGWLLCEV